MLEEGEAPNAITYRALISACEKGRQPEQALKVFKRMLEHGVVPSAITYNSLSAPVRRESCCQSKPSKFSRH